MENPAAPKQTPHPNKFVLALVGIFILILAVGGLWFAFRGTSKTPKSNVPVSTGTTSASSKNSSSSETQVSWMLTENGWQANGTPASCPSPVLKTPVDLTNVTTILYPGQTRGGNYKPHGGFRFDNAKSSNVTVTAPMDAVIVDGGRYLVNGEIQYTFDFIAPCGMMYRIGHLLVLDPKYQKIADKFPAAAEGDSRTENVNPQISVTAGETIATAVGVTKGGLNVFFDFGVYNLLTKNQASQDSTWASNPAHDPQLAQHAVCWFDLLPSADGTKVRSLPAGDPTSGKTSDYCK